MHGSSPIEVLGGEAAFGGNVVCHFIAMDTYVCFNFLQSDCCACLTSVKEELGDGCKGVSVSVVLVFVGLLHVLLNL